MERKFGPGSEPLEEGNFDCISDPEAVNRLNNRIQEANSPISQSVPWSDPWAESSLAPGGAVFGEPPGAAPADYVEWPSYSYWPVPDGHQEEEETQFMWPPGGEGQAQQHPLGPVGSPVGYAPLIGAIGVNQPNYESIAGDILNWRLRQRNVFETEPSNPNWLGYDFRAADQSRSMEFQWDIASVENYFQRLQNPERDSPSWLPRWWRRRRRARELRRESRRRAREFRRWRRDSRDLPFARDLLARHQQRRIPEAPLPVASAKLDRLRGRAPPLPVNSASEPKAATTAGAKKDSKQEQTVCPGAASGSSEPKRKKREMIAYEDSGAVYSEIAFDSDTPDDVFGDFSSGEQRPQEEEEEEANKSPGSESAVEMQARQGPQWPAGTSEQILNCASAAVTANFVPYRTTTSRTTTTTTFHHRKRPKTAENDPTTTSTGVEVGADSASSSSYSDGFGSLVFGPRRRSPSRGSLGQDYPEYRRGRNRSSFGCISMGHLRMMFKRNLVATLIGVYALISLLIIIVLILPYLLRWRPTADETQQMHNLRQENKLAQRMAELAKRNRDIAANQSEPGGAPKGDARILSKPLERADRDEGDPGPKTEAKSGDSETVGIHTTNKRVVRVEGVTHVNNNNNNNKQDHNSTVDRNKLRVYRQACQPLKVPFCSKEGSTGSDSGAYDWTLLPNRFGHARQSQVEKALGKYEPVLDIKCYPLMPLFLCSVYAPKCVQLTQAQLDLLEARNRTLFVDRTGNGPFTPAPEEPAESTTQSSDTKQLPAPQDSGTRLMSPAKILLQQQQQQQQQQQANQGNWSILVPPCRSLCREAIQKCRFFFEVLSLKLANLVDCEQLPESEDPNVCVGLVELKALQKARESEHCAEDKFRCSNGECIPKKWRCDSFPDCTDKSDELKCSLCRAESEFYCGNNICIEKRLVCNGIKNCKDGRDERQCMRLATRELPAQPDPEAEARPQSDHLNKLIGSKRKLEVWSATNDSWIPVCGAYWMPMPMSHAVCQVLGYSRAKETLILFGKPESVAAGAATAPAAPPPPAPARLKRKRSPRIGWFDAAGQRLFPVEAPQKGVGTPADSDIDHQDELQHQLASVVEDVASHASSIALIKSPPRAGSSKTLPAPRDDHLIEFASADDKFTSLELAGLQRADFKHPSLTSMLIHRPQAGCEDKPASLASNVYIQCENFQCGRPVTSFMTRVREENLQQQPQQQQQQPLAGQYSSSYRSALFNSNATPNRELIVRRPMLEATEEIGSEETQDRPSRPEAEEVDSGSVLGLLRNPFGLHSRIVGGIESLPGEFPYLAALHGGPDEVFFCGGVLISINWLLTASHCVGNRTKPDGWMVKVGVTRRVASPTSVRKLSVRKIIKHPEFDQNISFNNDIALILLEEVVEFNQYLRPICLPSANLRLRPENSKDCVVVGFGKSKFSQEAEYLQVAHFVNVPIVRHSTCSGWYAEQQINLTQGMLCAGYAEGKRDACQGDSGSGLFCRNAQTNQFFIAGVVSFGIKCATPKLPGVYTSVPAYVDWIEKTTRENGYPIN